MQDFEKLGQFYLGRRHDPTVNRAADELLLYDSTDLVTHAFCVGMTGSGKTGLCLALIEEAAIDGVPALIIDPKGDLGNLLLTFPGLAPEDFAPWVDEEEARRKGKSVADFAADQAAKWQAGLASWGQEGARIARLKNAAEFTIYTPGSTAGIPISILKSFAAPGASVAGDAELFRDRIQTTATSLLGLVGADADPIKSREHILLSTIFQSAWAQGRDLDLPGIIQQIQTPPVQRIGVMDVDTFFPQKDRFALAMSLNNLLAAPGFDVWMQGDALDVGQFLHTADGKPRVTIFSIAHLGDAERMFFVSLLLNNVVGWMRSQSGTTSLRAVVYMDEIAGYFPPVANPPSKAPLLTLLKQARAFGTGIVLSTQNPVDLDYKGLANCGTWFLGRLQTARDQARVLDGLEGSATTAGQSFDRQAMEQILAGLANRIFVMNNVHEDAPVIFESRWALSYLRGPLSRNEIRRLMAGRQAAPESARPSARQSVATTAEQPILPAGVSQYFLASRKAAAIDVTYRPMIYGSARGRCVHTSARIDAPFDVAVMTPLAGGPVPVDWNAGTLVDVDPSDLEQTPATGVGFAELPANTVTARSVGAWTKDFEAWVYSSHALELLRAAQSGQVSNPGESERDFRIRLQQSSREARDAMVEQLRRKYAPKIAAAQERLRRTRQAVDREAEQAKAQTLQTAISFGTTLIGAFLGRKTITASTLGRATTAARGVGRTLKETQDIGRAKETVGAVEEQLQQLDEEFRAETAAIEARFDAASEPLDKVACKPKKSTIRVALVAVVWAPYAVGPDGTIVPAWL